MNYINKIYIRYTSGFTILEMLIATVVFSLILLVLVATVTQVTNEYYRGLTVSQTQEIARDVINTISQAIQFSTAGSIDTVDSSTVLAGNENSFCIGTQYFDYFLDVEQGTGATENQNAFSTKYVSTCQENQGSATINLLGDNMRITEIKLSQVPGTTDLYSITVQLAYGSSSAFTNSPTHNISDGKGDAQCAPDVAVQFCAVSTLSTTIQRRY